MRALSVIIITTCITLFPQACRSQDQSHDLEKIAILRAGHEQWLHDVHFKSTFQLVQGTSVSQENARKGIIENDLHWEDGEPHRFSGVFNKSPDYIRMSKTPDAPPLTLPSDVYKRVPFDDIRSLSRAFQHFKGGSGHMDTIVTDKAENGQLRSAYVAGINSQEEISPLALYGGPPSAKFMDAPKGTPITITEPDDTRTRVSFTARYEAKTETRTITFRTDFSIPVLESIDVVTEYSNSARKVTRAGFADKFVECEGGPVPTRVIKVQGGITEPPLWIVSIWKSDDLATPANFNNAFVYDLQDKISVNGMPAALARKRLDVTTIQESNIIQKRLPGTIVERSDTMLYVSASVFVLLLLIALYHTRRKARQ